jgi:hypothetical protein
VCFLFLCSTTRRSGSQLGGYFTAVVFELLHYLFVQHALLYRSRAFISIDNRGAPFKLCFFCRHGFVKDGGDI